MFWRAPECPAQGFLLYPCRIESSGLILFKDPLTGGISCGTPDVLYTAAMNCKSILQMYVGRCLCTCFWNVPQKLCQMSEDYCPSMVNVHQPTWKEPIYLSIYAMYATYMWGRYPMWHIFHSQGHTVYVDICGYVDISDICVRYTYLFNISQRAYSSSNLLSKNILLVYMLYIYIDYQLTYSKSVCWSNSHPLARTPWAVSRFWFFLKDGHTRR